MGNKEQHHLVKTEREFYENMYEDLVKGLDLSKPISVLDYGSGTGGFASLLAEINPKINVTAVDSNPEAINLGKKHYDHLPNLEFIVSNEIPRENYDLIFGNLGLQKKGNKKTIQSFLNEAYTNLKNKGLISILDNPEIDTGKIKQIYSTKQNQEKSNFEGAFQIYNNNWIKMFEKAGFYSEKYQELPPNFFHYRGKKK